MRISEFEDTSVKTSQTGIQKLFSLFNYFYNNNNNDKGRKHPRNVKKFQKV